MPRKLNVKLSDPIFSEPRFAEGGQPTQDPSGMMNPPNDSGVYNQLGNLQKTEVTDFPQMQGTPDSLYTLASALGTNGPNIVNMLQNAITFHVVGDSGCSSAKKYFNELSVADAITADARSSTSPDPAFMYHVGDLVYNFGESQYYYDQFYEPYRDYPAPIFAIPGNHDSFVVPGTAKGDDPLDIFQRNFCAAGPTITPEAGSLHRTAMTQPGVYFTLDAPCVRIIGLFSNALEDPGVISSKTGVTPGGTPWPINDFQLAYLDAQLKKVVADSYAGALLIAIHHPPFSYAEDQGLTSHGGGNSAMLAEIDQICLANGVYPHAFLSGHAHNYQRYIRTIQFGGKSIQVPFLVIGNSGHNVNPLVSATFGSKAPAPPEPDFQSDVSYLDSSTVLPSQGLLLDEYDDSNYGYLTVTVTTSRLTISYNQVGDNRSGNTYNPTVVNLSR